MPAPSTAAVCLVSGPLRMEERGWLADWIANLLALVAIEVPHGPVVETLMERAALQSMLSRSSTGPPVASRRQGRSP